MELPIILFLTVVAPVWVIAHYAVKWRNAKTLSREDEDLLADLWATAEKMETRIRTLEKILDDEAPKWRDK